MRPAYIVAAIIAISMLSNNPAQAQGITPAFPSPGPYTLGQGFIAPKEPGKTLHEAHRNFLDEEYKIAAEDIRKAAAFLRLEAVRGAKEGNTLLKETADELEKLARKVESGAVESSRELDKAFARAHYALARQYTAMAAEAWAKKEAAQTGQYLEAAVYHFNYALAWTGRKIETESFAAVKKSRSVAKKLAGGAEVAADEVRDALKSMKDKLDWLRYESDRDD